MATERDLRRELLVWGYIREFGKNYKLMIIPVEINDVIYLYQRFYVRWSKEHSHKDFLINGQSLTFNSKNVQTAFEGNEVKEGVFKWKLKIVTNTMDYSKATTFPYIGIIESNTRNLKKYINKGSWQSVGCQLCPHGATFGHGVATLTGCEWYKQGDIMEIILDLNARTIRFGVNGENYDTGFDYIKQTSYRLALTARDAEGSEFIFVE